MTSFKFSSKISPTRIFFHFLPLNLFEQFHRFANVYFVFIAILNFVPQVGAIDPYLALGPPIFILTVTAVKDGYENYRRYRSDREINSTLSKVYCQAGIHKWLSNVHMIGL
jgi:magnesium-transporting ATPase (P-type)